MVSAKENGGLTDKCLPRRRQGHSLSSRAIREARKTSPRYAGMPDRTLGHKAISHPTSSAFLESDGTPPPISHSWNPRQYAPMASPAVVEGFPSSLAAPTSLNSHELLTRQEYSADIISSMPSEVPTIPHSSKNRGLPLFSSSGIQYPSDWQYRNAIAEIRHQGPDYHGHSGTGLISTAGESHLKAASAQHKNASSTGTLHHHIVTSGTTGAPRHTHRSERAIPYPVQRSTQNDFTEEIVIGSTLIEPLSPPTSSVETRHPPRKLTIRDLMNDCDVGDSDSGQTDDSQHMLTATTSSSHPMKHPMRSTALKDSRGIQKPYESQLPHTLQDVTRIRRPAARRKHERQSDRPKHDDHDHHAVLKANISKKRKQDSVTAALAKSNSPPRDMKPAP